jgi:hypothetical protein
VATFFGARTRAILRNFKNLKISTPNLKKKVYDFLKGNGLTNGSSSD